MTFYINASSHLNIFRAKKILSSQQIFHKYTSWSSDFNAPWMLISLHEWWDLFTLFRIKFYGVIVLMNVIFSLLHECPVAYESIAITKQTFIMTSLAKEMYNKSEILISSNFYEFYFDFICLCKSALCCPFYKNYYVQKIIHIIGNP